MVWTGWHWRAFYQLGVFWEKSIWGKCVNCRVEIKMERIFKKYLSTINVSWSSLAREHKDVGLCLLTGSKLCSKIEPTQIRGVHQENKRWLKCNSLEPVKWEFRVRATFLLCLKDESIIIKQELLQSLPLPSALRVTVVLLGPHCFLQEWEVGWVMSVLNLGKQFLTTLWSSFH